MSLDPINSNRDQPIRPPIGQPVGATSEHFGDRELACRHCGVNACRTGIVIALEAFRTLVGRPVIVDCAYRCPVHNGQLPNAAAKSEHVMGIAADIRVTGMTAAELESVALQIPAITGIGRNDWENYLHIDTRSATSRVRWCYDARGRWTSYFPATVSVARADPQQSTDDSKGESN